MPAPNVEFGLARLRAKAAVREEEQAARRLFPQGSHIQWTRGSQPKRHEGSVVAHGYGRRIKVENVVTGREYWISYDDVHVEEF